MLCFNLLVVNVLAYFSFGYVPRHPEVTRDLLLRLICFTATSRDLSYRRDDGCVNRMTAGYFMISPITPYYNFANFNLKLLLTTDIELNAIAAPAIIGFNKNPLTGYNTPAAIGIPIRL